jgi:hypothetical protein
MFAKAAIVLSQCQSIGGRYVITSLKKKKILILGGGRVMLLDLLD